MAKLPTRRRAWPAIWMLPDSIHEGVNWPNCGEIDIMEFIPTRGSKLQKLAFIPNP